MLKTIKGKITIGVMAISIAIVIIINAIVWNVFENNLEKYIINDMEKMKTMVLAEIIKSYSIGERKINDENRTELWKILSKVNSQYDVYVSVDFDEKENIWYVGEILNEEKKGEIIKESHKKSSWIYFNNNQSEYIATYSYPIYMYSGYVATIVFQKDYIENYENYLLLIKVIILTQSILFFIMITFIYWWLKKSTEPLKVLIDGMEQIQNGDYSSRLECTSKDEVGRLVESFNTMQEKILTQMSQLEDEKEKYRELEKSSREFFNNATHEMKTPIAGISGYTQILQSDNVDETIKTRAYERILLECTRIEDMVKNMLVVAKGKEIINNNPEFVYIDKLVKEVKEEFEFYLHKNKIKIKLDSCNEKVYGIREEIKTILKNLMDNALKYTSDSKINISIKNIEEKVVIEIENKTKSIPLELRNKLFEPFAKYNYGDNRKVSSGLGLFICKDLAYKNNCELDYIVAEENIKFVFKLLKS